MITVETPSEREMYERYADICASDNCAAIDILDAAWFPIYQAMVSTFNYGQTRTAHLARVESDVMSGLLKRRLGLIGHLNEENDQLSRTLRNTLKTPLPTIVVQDPDALYRTANPFHYYEDDDIDARHDMRGMESGGATDCRPNRK